MDDHDDDDIDDSSNDEDTADNRNMAQIIAEIKT